MSDRVNRSTGAAVEREFSGASAQWLESQQDGKHLGDLRLAVGEDSIKVSIEYLATVVMGRAASPEIPDSALLVYCGFRQWDERLNCA